MIEAMTQAGNQGSQQKTDQHEVYGGKPYSGKSKTLEIT